MKTKQEYFEDSIYLESELSYNNGYRDIQFSLDNIEKYDTFADISTTENNEDIDFTAREALYAMVNNKLDSLTPLQKKIAKLRLIENRTYREISTIIDKSISTINFHIKKINKALKI